MIPPALTLRYDRLRELQTAQDLLDSVHAAGIIGQEEQFLSDKIRDLERELDETDAETQRLIDQLTEMSPRLFAGLHFQAGYPWAEIAGIFNLSEDAVKSCVYRALRRANL